MTALLPEIATGLHAYSPDRPLVLVTEYAPDATGGGAVILRGLLTAEERARVAWLTLTPFREAAAEGWAAMARVGSGPSIWPDSTVRRRAIADEIVGRARDLGGRALWLMAHGAVVPAAARLTKSGGLPVHLTVHDDPVGQALASRRYRALAPWFAHTFRASLRRAKSVDTISEAMARRYRERVGVASSVVHRGIAGPVNPSADHDPARGLSVGVIGSIYEYSMMKTLARAVAIAAGARGIAGRVVVVGQGVGARLKAEFEGVIDVEVTGPLGEAEAVDRLRQCFLLYVNYPFERRFGLFRQTSFPTKISTYAQAARPLLVHAPADSSVVPLCDLPDGYATHWNSTLAEEGASTMLRLWDDPAGRRSRHEAGEAVRARYYDRETHRATLFGLLNALAKDGR